MEAMGKEEYLERGRNYARRGNYDAALKSLNIALKQYLGPNDGPARMTQQALSGLPSELLSYYGLCIAYAENRIEEGVRLCEMALAREVLRPEFYLNLGRIYLKTRRRGKALETFRMGLEITEKNQELLQEVRKLGLRRKPVFGFLSREHFLNRCFGLLVDRLTGKRA